MSKEEGESLSDTFLGMLAEDDDEPAQGKQNKNNEVIKITKNGNKLEMTIGANKYWCNQQYMAKLMMNQAQYALFFKSKW